jgi:hypothetical protein
MSYQSKFEAFRKAAGELFAGLAITAVSMVVVGGTIAMLVQPSPLFA